MSLPPVRVAICEDSLAYASGLRRYLETGGELEVTSVVETAEQLIAELPRTRPDVVTMDLELPGMDGTEAIRRIMSTRPVAIVVLSNHVGRSARRVAEALAAGALEAIPKSEVRLAGREDAAATSLRRRLVALGRNGPVSARSVAADRSPSEESPVRRLPRPGVATVIGVAASAGGPRALADLLGLLPAGFPLPVLVVQHMSEGFMSGLAAWLDDSVSAPVRLARDGEPLGSGIKVAPEGAHLILGADGRLHLDRATTAGPHRPSADVLLTSLAKRAGRGAVAVVLTGMGRDGAAGVAAVCAAGGAAVAERADQAAVWGMPVAAADAGAISLELTEIGELLASLTAPPPT
jgi:two-component system chemotaxis response regulator CheB